MASAVPPREGSEAAQADSSDRDRKTARKLPRTCCICSHYQREWTVSATLGPALQITNVMPQVVTWHYATGRFRRAPLHQFQPPGLHTARIGWTTAAFRGHPIDILRRVL